MEQKQDGKEKLQILICDCHDVANKKMIEIQRNKMTVAKFIDIAKKDMGLAKTCKIYRENGAELTSSNMYRIINNDALYASDGKLLQQKYDSMNLCVMGAGAVGKSAITLRFIQGQFVSNYDPTIEDAYRKQIDVDGNQLLLDILDTAGQEDFECLRTQWMKNKDAFILVYSIVRKTSFDQLKEFYDGIKEVYDDQNNIPPIILVGNKVDLDENHIAYIDPSQEIDQDEDDEDDEEDEPPKKGRRANGRVKDYSDSDSDVEPEKLERQVTFEEAVAFGRKIGVSHYVETSAKSGLYIFYYFIIDYGFIFVICYNL